MAALPPELTYGTIERTAVLDGLSVTGGVHEDGTTILLLGPGREFWRIFKVSAEMQDGAPDPVDRWSARVIGRLANHLKAEPLLPFGGPPYLPFLRWALASGRAWSSPVGMLVHDEAGMMVSFRGALKFAGEMTLPTPPDRAPCETCQDKPCTTACPVSALSDQHVYEVDACHAYLDTRAGQDCMAAGCLARRACPISQSFDRLPEQSAHHMRYFHPI